MEYGVWYVEYGVWYVQVVQVQADISWGMSTGSRELGRPFIVAPCKPSYETPMKLYIVLRFSSIFGPYKAYICPLNIENKKQL